MKTVVFVRHGKSSWKDPSLSDHDRPLKSRGFRDANLVATILKNNGIEIDKIYSSSALRAKQTAVIFKQTLDIEKIEFDKALYLVDEEEIINRILSMEENCQSLMFFGHNPGYTGLINLFSSEHFYNVPTAGAFQVDFPVDRWDSIDIRGGNLKEYWFPKDHK